MFGPSERAKASLGIPIEKFGPSRDALISGHFRMWRRGFNPGDGLQLVECLMFHGQLLS